jgi:signal transduction histidine kinase
MKICLSTYLLVFFGILGCKGQVRPTYDTIHVNTYKKITDSAKAHALKGDTTKALYYHKQALLHTRAHGLQEHEAHTLMHIGILLKGQDTSQSRSYLKNALKIAERLNKHELRANILLAMSSVYKQQQNYKESLAALEAHQKLLQDIFRKSRAQETAKLRAEESRQRERAIFLTVMISLTLLIAIFAFYYQRTKRLNKALFQSNQIKDTLFSIIGHDLRGPAGSIMQALEMVDAGLLDEQEEKQVIKLLKQQSRSFNETLNTLLSWASAQLKGAQPHITSVDAMTTIKKSLDLLMAQAMAKDISINSPNYHDLPVMADRDQLDFVIRNLVSNAIKFSYTGGQIDITTEKRDNAAIIAVHDHGKGIPADKQRQLFAEGRLNSTFGTQGEKGTGLGLMLSWDFIRANRGCIWFDSNEDTGTTFYISLPLAAV